jgi:hypothetical protein
MKKLILLAAVLAGGAAAHAQTIVKPVSLPMNDSIVYQVENAVFIFDKQHVEDYFKGLDTILPQRKYDNKVFRNIQFAHLNQEEVQRHYAMANKFWAASKTSPLHYSTDRISLFWNDTETILMPYLDEILPELLEQGWVQVVERSTGKRVAQFRIDYEDIDLKTFRIFRFNKVNNRDQGKLILRESDIFLEQMHNVQR